MRSTPGVIVNRFARPFYVGAQRLLQEGVADPSTLDAVKRQSGRFGMRPFELVDLIGQGFRAQGLARNGSDAHRRDAGRRSMRRCVPTGVQRRRDQRKAIAMRSAAPADLRRNIRMSQTSSTRAEAQDLSERVGRRMFERDTASQGMGMRIEAIGPGTARLSMVVRGDMLNGLGSCHGGFLFALADSAFAFCCNSRNDATVAAGCSIEYLRPVREGETLTAVAQERALVGRSGVYDVSVLGADGQPVALFRGRSARVKGEIVPPT